MADPSSYTLSEAPWAVILAAGKGSRLAKATDGTPKQFLPLNGRPLFWASFETFQKTARMGGAVFVFPPDSFEESRSLLESIAKEAAPGLAFRAVAGGARRQDSVRNGLAAVPAKARHVLIHDSARPFFTPALANAILDRLEGGAKAAIPGVPVTDTIKRVQNGAVVETPPREQLVAVQTPQGFERACIVRLHEDWVKNGDADVTDDAALAEACGVRVEIVEGERANMKITNPEDLERLGGRKRELAPCTGFGYDVHRYGGDRPIVLGGVRMEGTDLMVSAHSDGDVLLHALMDALLGLAGRGDIGAIFPDTDPAYDNASSALLLAHVLDLLRKDGIRLLHVDCTVVAQLPKVGPQRQAIKKNLCRLLGLLPEHVSVKATTEEKLGFTGEIKGIKAYALASALCPAKG